MSRNRIKKKAQLKNNRLRGLFHKAIKEQPRLACQYPIKGGCNMPVINSHSIQKAGPLRLLADNSNHVVMLKANFSTKSAPLAEAKVVGINKATVFNGLCAEHDSQLFAKIENKSLDFKDRETLFLFSYRSVLREVHAKKCQLHLAEQISSIIKEPGGQHAKFSSSLYGIGVKSGEYWLQQTKNRYDEILLSKKYNDNLWLWKKILPYQIGFAAATCFTPSVDFDGKRINNLKDVDKCPNNMIIIAHPMQGKSVLIACILKEQQAALSSITSKIELSSEKNLELLLSELLLRNSENIVLSNSYWKSIGYQKRKIVVEFFNKTILSDNGPFPGENANIFCKTSLPLKHF